MLCRLSVLCLPTSPTTGNLAQDIERVSSFAKASEDKLSDKSAYFPIAYSVFVFRVQSAIWNLSSVNARPWSSAVPMLSITESYDSASRLSSADNGRNFGIRRFADRWNRHGQY